MTWVYGLFLQLITVHQEITVYVVDWVFTSALHFTFCCVVIWAEIIVFLYFHLFCFCSLAAFRLREQEKLHPQSRGHQHRLGAAEQRALQGHGDGENRGGGLRRASCFLQTRVLTGGGRERAHQQDHRHGHRQGPGLYGELHQVR